MDYTSEVKITQHSHDSECSPGKAVGPGEPSMPPVNNTDNKLIACRSAPVAAWRLPAPALTPLLLRCLSPWARHRRSWRHVTAATWKNENQCRPSRGEIAGADSPPAGRAAARLGCGERSRVQVHQVNSIKTRRSPLFTAVQ